MAYYVFFTFFTATIFDRENRFITLPKLVALEEAKKVQDATSDHLDVRVLCLLNPFNNLRLSSIFVTDGSSEDVSIGSNIN